MTALTVTSAQPLDLSEIFNLENFFFASPSLDSATSFEVSIPGYVLDFGGSGFTYPDASGNDLPTDGTITSISISQANPGNPAFPIPLAGLNGFSMTLAQLEGYLQQGTSALLAALFSTNDTAPGGNDTVTFSAQNFDPTLSLNLGAGSIDTVSITGSSTQTIQMLDASLQNVEVLNLGTPSFNHNGGAIPVSMTVVMADGNVAAGQTMTVWDTLGPLGKLIFDAAAEIDGNYNVEGGDGTDLITTGEGNNSVNTGNGTDAVTTGGGNDTIAVVDKQVVVHAGTGNDTVYMGSFGQPRVINAGDIFDGGSDPSGNNVDTLVFNSGGRIPTASGSGFRAEVDKLGPTTVTNFEVFKFMNGFNDGPGAWGSYIVTTNDATVAAGKTLTVDCSLLYGANVNFDGELETDGQFKFIGSRSDPVYNPGATDVFTGGANADEFDFSGSNAALANLFGNAGNDTFNFTFNAFLAAAKPSGQQFATDFVDGGGGNDTLSIDGDYSAPVYLEGVSPAGTPPSQTHKGTLTSIEDVKFLAGGNYNFVLADMKDPAGTEFDGSALASGNFIRIDGSQVIHDNLILLGGAGNDTLIGSQGSDALIGGAGQNTFDISAGGGDNVLGGGGNDTIIAGSALGGGDTVNGGGGIDTIVLDGNYGALGSPFVPGSATLQSVEIIQLTGGTKATGNLGYYFQLNDNALAATQNNTLTVDGHALTNRDIMNIDGSHVHAGSLVLIGGPNGDTLTGGALGDTIQAGDGANNITGGGGADVLSGGNGIDEFFYNAVSDSTVKASVNAFDTITNLDLAHDRLHFAGVTVTAVDNAVAGTTAATSPTSMANALTADLAGLQAGHAVLYDGQDGHVYLVVNAHGTAGFHTNADYVMNVTGALHGTATTTHGLTIADFF